MIQIIDRKTGQIEEEKVYGGALLKFFYGNPIGRFLNIPLAKCSWISALFGWWQRRSFTKSKVEPFIQEFGVDASEFEGPFSSFNDFFIRKLKAGVRPIGTTDVVMPADGRYLFFKDINKVDGFLVKGEKFDLRSFLMDDQLATEYQNSSMVIARLCPTDYHRFHFPIDCTPGRPRLINGDLFSVNPMALKQNIHIFTQNKRVITDLGSSLFIEVGATNVGSIHQTFTPGQFYKKGDEKGYFSFGGSSIVMLFKNIDFEKDLLGHSLELRCLMGQKMGDIIPHSED